MKKVGDIVYLLIESENAEIIAEDKFAFTLEFMHNGSKIKMKIEKKLVNNEEESC